MKAAPTQETVPDRKRNSEGLLSDKLSARLMGIADTGNGRRESYEHIPMPRMTNTYMLAGQDNPEDIIRSVKRGHLRRQLRRRPGRHHQRQVRVWSIGSLHDRRRPDHQPPIKRRNADRQRPRCSHASLDGRQRFETRRRRRHLRQRRASCACWSGIPTIKIDRLTVGGTAKKDPGGFMQ